MVRSLRTTILLAGGIAPSLVAQVPEGEPTTIQYYRDNVQIGSDQFSIRAQGGDHIFRSRVTVADRGERIATEITFDGVWQPLQVQMEVRGRENLTIRIQFSERRITFRSVSPTGESARELPRRGVIVLIDDDMPSLYAVLQYVPPGEVTLFRIRSASSTTATLIDHGLTAPPSDTVGLRLRHIELRAEDGAHQVWLDEDGETVSVEQPVRHYRAAPTRED